MACRMSTKAGGRGIFFSSTTKFLNPNLVELLVEYINIRRLSSRANEKSAEVAKSRHIDWSTVCTVDDLDAFKSDDLALDLHFETDADDAVFPRLLLPLSAFVIVAYAQIMIQQ